MKFLYLTFPNGEVYRTRARPIAEERARYYAEKDHPDDVDARKETFEDEVEYALSDEYEVTDWAMNNMGWDDIRGHLTRVEGPQEVEKDDFYNTADVDIRDVDPEDDPDKPDGLSRGVYLLADTPTTAIPLETEAGDGDRALLREVLAEHGAPIDGGDA